LLCWQDKTLYDVIITRINRFVGDWENPKSTLVTAYAPQGVEGTTMLEQAQFYLDHLTRSIGGKVVNLVFKAGEIGFFPE
jgi:hypothetical protein